MNDWTTSFALESRYDDAKKCLEDALLVAREREYQGLAHLVDAALADLLLIGRLTGINGQQRIEGGAS